MRTAVPALEVNITDVEGRSDESIRERPFATGANAFKVAIKPPSAAWDRMFGGFVPPQGDTTQRDLYVRCARYDWQALGEFVLRLRNTPEGDGNMLDNTLVLGISHFGGHHDIRRLPTVLFGTAKGGLRTDRYLRFGSPINNDTVLTSVAQLMGVQVNGFGDDGNCGPVPGLV